MTKYFWHYAIKDDTAAHASRGVGPASDFQTPQGTPLHAPFAGRMETFENEEGGNGVRIYGEHFTYVGQHNENRVASRNVAWREALGINSGNTGSKTNGPHHHAYIIVHATGKRISFYEWLRDYVNKGNTAPSKPATPTGVVGRELELTVPWFWYPNAQDAANTYRPKGGKYGGGTMLSGPYKILNVSSRGAVEVLSNANGRAWLHPSVLSSPNARLK